MLRIQPLVLPFYLPHVALASLLGVGLGLGLASWTRPTERDSRPQAAEPLGRIDSVEVADAGLTSDASTVIQETTLAPTAAPEPVIPPASVPSTGAGSFRAGRVAYLKCGEVEQCGRHHAFERAVWSLLETLPTCPTWDPQSRGEGDVRLHYASDGVSFRFREVAGGLDARMLNRCLLPSRAPQPPVATTPFSVSFRFEILSSI